MTAEGPGHDELTADGKLLRTTSTPKTPLRCFRVPDTLYRAVQAKAAANGDSVSDVVRRYLHEYIA